MVRGPVEQHRRLRTTVALTRATLVYCSGVGASFLVALPDHVSSRVRCVTYAPDGGTVRVDTLRSSYCVPSAALGREVVASFDAVEDMKREMEAHADRV